MEIREQYEVGFAFSEAHVDVDAGLIENVSLLGAVSKNGYRYSRNALSEAATLHKGVGVYLDHPTDEIEEKTGGVRSVRDMAGQVIRARVDGDRVKGTIQILRGTGPGETLLALVEQMPGAVGFSHRADGVFNEDEDIVLSITKVDGADVVTAPATVQGLFESWRNPENPENDPPKEDNIMEIKDLTLEELTAQRPDLVTSVQKASENKRAIAEQDEELTRLREFKKVTEAKDVAAEKIRRIEEKLVDAGLPDETKKDEDVRKQLIECATEDAEDLAIANLVRAFQIVERTTGRKYTGPRLHERDHDRDDLRETAKGDVTQEDLAKAYDAAWG